MREDPNYNEVSVDVDMRVEQHRIFRKPLSFIRKIINWIFLAFQKFWNRINGKRYDGLKCVSVEDLTEKKLQKLGRNREGVYYSKNEAMEDLRSLNNSGNDEYDKLFPPRSMSSSVYAIRNKKTGSVVMMKGTAETIKSMYGNGDFEVVEAAIKE